MTNDEKLAVIAGNLRMIDELSDKREDLLSGTVFELVSLALECDSADDALAMARLVIPHDDREAIARFCQCYCRYSTEMPYSFPMPESSDVADTVAIPEIAKLENAIAELKAHGVSLELVYGDSFSSCAESVEYGHVGYALMPMSDPVEGRLRSFDRLRERFGLKIHRVLSIRDDGGMYSYQLCGIGFPDSHDGAVARVSFTADVNCSPMAYLDGVRVFGADVISSETLSGDVSRVCAVLDVDGICETDLTGLMMYLRWDADLTIDGCYAEIK